MERLVYRSEASHGLPGDAVFRIVDQSARNNPRRSTTGFLIYHDNRFLQLLEGPASALDELLTTLQRDPRHHSIDILLRSPTDVRWFPDWGMKRLVSFSTVPALEELRAKLQAVDDGPRVLALVDDFLG